MRHIQYPTGICFKESCEYHFFWKRLWWSAAWCQEDGSVGSKLNSTFLDLPFSRTHCSTDAISTSVKAIEHWPSRCWNSKPLWGSKQISAADSWPCTGLRCSADQEISTPPHAWSVLGYPEPCESGGLPLGGSGGPGAPSGLGGSLSSFSLRPVMWA